MFSLFFKRNREAWARVIFFYVLYSLANDTCLFILPRDDNYYKLTYTLLIGYTLIEYSLFAFFIWKISETKIISSIILICSILFYFFIFYYYFSEKTQSFDSLSASVESILILVYCICYLFEQLNKPQVIFIYETSGFWFVIGMMVYLAGNFFLFVQASDLPESVRDNFWKINLICNTFKNVFFAIAFIIPEEESSKISIKEPLEGMFKNPR